MSVIIKDGASGKTAQIDNNNRLKTAALTEVFESHACEKGLKFNINTGDITVTNATETSVLYVKNNEDSDLVIASLIYALGNTTSGTGDVKIEVIRNPTAGGIITNANVVAVGTGLGANQNFGSANTLDVDAFKGATGETLLSGGSVSLSTRLAANTGRTVLPFFIVLPKGTSMGINYTPPASNTSQKVQFAISCWLQTDEVTGGVL